MNQTSESRSFFEINPTPIKTTEAIAQPQNQIRLSANFDWTVFRNKKFWIEDPIVHEEEYDRSGHHCCFNHIIGLPEKKHMGHDYYTSYPLFDYQVKLQKILERYKKVAIYKARGLGITEYFLRYMSWLCLRDNRYRNQDMCIIAGPRMELATDLILRLKSIFFGPTSGSSGLRVVFGDDVSNQRMLILNDVKIRAFPSHNPNAIRLLKDPAFIFTDEADFFHQKEHFNVKDAAEGAGTKSDPWIIFVSTPNKPRGFMESMMNQEPTKYYKMRLDYTYGLPRSENNNLGIYTQEEIEEVKQDPAFEREYNLKPMGQVGSIFSTLSIKNATTDVQYNPDDINTYGLCVMGIDPGFGSSPVGVCVLQFGGDAKIQVLLADDYERLASSEMISLLWDKIQKYNPRKILIDGNNPEWVKDLKLQIGEDPRYHEAIARMKKSQLNYQRLMKVIPVNFGEDGKAMLGHAKSMIENDRVRIHPNFDKLITALGSASENGEGTIDKEDMAYSDVFDAFRLALFYFRASKERKE